MNMKPFIGMNLAISSGPPRKIGTYTTYHESIIFAGGIPLLIPPLPESDIDHLLDRLDGVLLIGGDDYSPARYGEASHFSVCVVDAQQEEFDFLLMNKLLKKPKLPILGLCNGMQLINIAAGGSLIQDIPTQMPESAVKHKGDAGWKVKDWHEVTIKPDCKLMEIYKKEHINVPTAHHQGIKQLGKDLKSSAHTDDGIVEALELITHNFAMGVQWHAERDLVINGPLFHAFVAEATKYKKLR